MINEISEQLNHVIDALAADLYHPLGEIVLEGFLAGGALTLQEAETHAREPWPAGTAWGKPWDYAWMFGRFTVPKEARGERIVMDLNPGGEATLFVNGRAFGARLKAMGAKARVLAESEYSKDIILNKFIKALQ